MSLQNEVRAIRSEINSISVGVEVQSIRSEINAIAAELAALKTKHSQSKSSGSASSSASSSSAASKPAASSQPAASSSQSKPAASSQSAASSTQSSAASKPAASSQPAASSSAAAKPAASSTPAASSATQSKPAASSQPAASTQSKPAASSTPAASKPATSSQPAASSPSAQPKSAANQGPPAKAGSIQEVYESIQSDSNPLTYVIINYNGSSLAVGATGSGELSEAIGKFVDDGCQFGYVRVVTGDKESKRAKFVLITWLGDKAKVMQKAKMPAQKSELKQIIKNVSVEFQAGSRDELDPKKLLEYVVKAGGANYSGNSAAKK
eukprot:TRINITY_DN2636_c0_g1_i3.p1 TRINITY_DN2636_c0_g1~~TRINITY_DN2636_c0_g1_i3.p1  ORF type:complete len:324 (-),score=139.56 TRINITY_DN2636_c0_g1_i3:84-1055(-)